MTSPHQNVVESALQIGQGYQLLKRNGDAPAGGLVSRYRLF